MNKVVSVEIATQVFWMEQEAYDVLRAYLHKIQSQLAGHEDARDIFADIELRVSELLYEHRANKNSAIMPQQVHRVIEQVGFLDGEMTETQRPRRSYLDPRNKILGGVCAGLSARWKVPAFILRLMFLSLTAVFGLGVVLYLIFWVSLESASLRQKARGDEGSRGLSSDMTFDNEAMPRKPIPWQKIIFFPVTIVGLLIDFVRGHFTKRKGGYLWLIKNIVFVGLLLASAFLIFFIYKINAARLFPWPASWLLSLCAMYLIVLTLMRYIQLYYKARPYRRLKRSLKIVAFAASGALMVALGYTLYQQSNEQYEQIAHRFTLNGDTLALVFNEDVSGGWYKNKVRFRITTSENVAHELGLQVKYASAGSSEEKALQNLQSIEYRFNYENDRLALDRYWTLPKGVLNRAQQVEVMLTIPRDIQITSSHLLTLDTARDPYQYNIGEVNQDGRDYFSSGLYFHERGDGFRNRLSDNEKQMLAHRFCEAFFIGETWHCKSSVRLPVASNSRFDRAFLQDQAHVDEIRKYLQPDRRLFVIDLEKIERLMDAMAEKYPEPSQLQIYIDHVQKVKSVPD